MIWRCLGRGIAATVLAYLTAIVIDQFSLWGRWIILLLAPLFIIGLAWWGASGATSRKQGALCGALTVSVPAVFGTGLFLLLQYEWGGPHVFNVDHIYASLILLGIPVLLAAAAGATRAKSKGEKA